MADKVNTNSQNIILDNTETADLAGFFDLLAKFDHQDRTRSVVDNTSLVSAPRGVLSVTNRDNLDKNPAVRTSGKTCSVETVKGL
jgi:alpha-glucuronidase